ncbi:hypothetical protein DRJ25_03985 [Candidatus Woesearchaeota archaeon]|nr:MAG: hypothetical protein DRJ25_03985 [Candidatus Woesearchaeota archaeon]
MSWTEKGIHFPSGSGGVTRYAIIEKVSVYAGEDKIGEIFIEDGIGFKAKLEDAFMSRHDIEFVGKVLEFMDENGDVAEVEEII